MSLKGPCKPPGRRICRRLTAGKLLDSEGTLLAGTALRSVVVQMRRRFDLVFIDGPAWEEVPETDELGSACDAVYLVLRQADANTPEVEALLKAIPDQGGGLRGCVLRQQ